VSIEAVVFDMDGVLCRNDRARRLAVLAAWSGMSPDAIEMSIFASGFEDEAERGVIDADEYLAGTAARIGYPLSADQWIEARRAAMTPDVEVLEIARTLGERMNVGMFTNNPLLLQRHFDAVFPEAARLFGDRAVFSAQLGHVKPTVEAFRGLVAYLGHEPEEVLFFDDWLQYVEGAAEAGLRSWHVTCAADVRAGLEAYGLQA
jgi:HAD superfamily hydrolase (TIGR01509 family)